MKNTQVHFYDWGRVPYAQAWQRQKELLQQAVDVKVHNRTLPAEAQQPVPNTLIFNEHNPVYTLGKSGDLANVLLSETELAERGIEYFHIERGGDITYHGPGQITGYLIFDLENFRTDLSWYLRSIEEAIIQTISHYGLVGGRIAEYTGVWVGVGTPTPRKICAIGIKASRWVTMHGFAFNVNTDLDYFGHIIPCGIADEDKGVTSLAAELGREIDLDEVKPLLRQALADQFGFQLD